jgi:hypothetical protein
MKDIYELTNWLSKDQLANLHSIALSWPQEEYVAKEGKFADRLVATQSWHTWNDTDELAGILKDKMYDILGDHTVIEVDYVELFLPWDIHCDFIREVKGSKPWYSLLIPFEDCKSRTIFFDQTADYNDFYIYKQNNPPVEHPVDLDFWNKNLSHCWDDDRLFLSLKYVGHEWHQGNATIFKRELFHSSDNYHLFNDKPKKFLQILTDLK